ncbi:MAG: ATP-binding protein [Chthoniobacteraceae bacterium]
MLKEKTRMHEGSILIRLPVDVREIERLNTLVRRFGELHEVPSRALYAVNLALDELVTNTILYGFEDTAGEWFRVRVEVRGTELHGELVDEGRHFNPLEAPAPDLDAPLREREVGGLGIHLVRSLMDRLDYRREETKNVLTLMKRIR